MIGLVTSLILNHFFNVAHKQGAVLNNQPANSFCGLTNLVNNVFREELFEVVRTDYPELLPLAHLLFGNYLGHDASSLGGRIVTVHWHGGQCQSRLPPLMNLRCDGARPHPAAA